MRERALQRHTHFHVSKADISVRSPILATSWQLLFYSRSVARKATVRTRRGPDSCFNGACVFASRGKALQF